MCKVVIAQALGELGGKYGALAQAVQKAGEGLMLQYLQEPEIKTALASAVRQGIAEATAKLTGEVRGKIEDLALKSIESAITSAARNPTRY